MACCCKQMLMKALEGLAKMPLAALAALIPKDLPFPQMAALPSLLFSAGLGFGGSMSMSAMASLAASARLSASLTASAVARLEALAAIKLALGINPLAVNASASLGLAIRSMNMHLPSIMALLLKALQPIMQALSDLIAMLTTASIVNMTLGINLMLPGGAMKLGLALGAALRASVSASVAASVSAAANLAMHARLVAAASALGFNLLLPGGLAQLNAALRLSASLGLPGLNLDLGNLITLSSLLAQLAAIQAAFNVNLMLPNAAALLAAALAPLLAALSSLAGLGIPLGLGVGAGLNASAAAAASLSASAQASLQAVASANLSAGLFGVPSLGSLGLAANLALQLGLASGTGVMQTSPCGSCPLTGGW